MGLNITPVNNHREREKGIIVYPVYSRRSAGLPIGVNLYPDKKSCSFDCPYCEVFPFSSDALFTLEQLEMDLRSTIASAQEREIEIKDICFSGNGEPTLSPFFGDALKMANNIRGQMAPLAELVVITNGAGLLQADVFSQLCDAASPSFNIWLKLDAGTPQWYEKMNRSALPFDILTQKKKEFVSCNSVTIQTMLCAINGEEPPAAEAQAWEALVCELAAIAAKGTGGIRKVQLYGKARPAPEDPLASLLPASYLEERAASLRTAFAGMGLTTPVVVYL